jgi:hypothetical protein
MVNKMKASDLQLQMKKGINLGSTFECQSQSRESSRVNKLFTAWKAKGFDHVRIPVTWYGSSKTCKLDDANFMRQLKSAVDYALALGFTVILNAHHEEWLYSGYNDTEVYNGMFWNLWRRIALFFNYVPQEDMIFQILNEPHGVFDDSIEWTRKINEVGYHGVRKISTTRLIAFQPNFMGNIYQAPKVYPTLASLPGNPDYLMVSIHSYDAFAFCGQEGYNSYYASTGDLSQSIDRLVGYINKWKSTNGIPVILDECGVGRLKSVERDTDIVRHYYKYISNAFVNVGIPVTTWNDEGWFCVSTIGTNGVYHPCGLINAFLSK